MNPLDIDRAIKAMEGVVVVIDDSFMVDQAEKPGPIVNVTNGLFAIAHAIEHLAEAVNGVRHAMMHQEER